MSRISSQTIKLSKGTILVNQGGECEQFITVKTGRVKVFARSPQGKEVLLYYIYESETCVLTTSCLIGGDEFPAEAVAVTNIELEILSKKEFFKKLDLCSNFRGQVFKNFSLRLKELILKLEEITSESIPQRIAKFLLSQLGQDVHITHTEVAQEIGTIREVVSRTLKLFEKDDALILKRGVIAIKDRNYLIALSK